MATLTQSSCGVSGDAARELDLDPGGGHADQGQPVQQGQPLHPHHRPVPEEAGRPSTRGFHFWGSLLQTEQLLGTRGPFSQGNLDFNRIRKRISQPNQGQPVQQGQPLHPHHRPVPEEAGRSPTLNPQSSTLNPQPSTLSPQPSTLSHQPSTLNPQPSAPNPQTSAINPQPPTLNPQPSTLDPQPSTLNPQPSTPNHKQ